MPAVSELVWAAPGGQASVSSIEYDATGSPQALRDWSLAEGLGGRRLAVVQCRAAVQLLLVQAAGELYARHCRRLPSPAVVVVLDVLRGVSTHARVVDGDMVRWPARISAVSKASDLKRYFIAVIFLSKKRSSRRMFCLFVGPSYNLVLFHSHPRYSTPITPLLCSSSFPHPRPQLQLHLHTTLSYRYLS
jgi:hypothetical protein